MSQKAEHKLIFGNTAGINQELAVLAASNWRPILMSTTISVAGTTNIYVILERLVES